MHQNNAAAQFGDGCHHLRVPTQGANIVYDLGASGNASARYFMFVGIDRNNGGRTFSQYIFNHGQHAGQFFCGRQPFCSSPGSGPGGFPANVKDVGTFVQHLQSVADCLAAC